MIKSSFRNASTIFISRIQCRTVSTLSNGQRRNKVEIKNQNFLSFNLKNGFENRNRFFNDSRPILSNFGPERRNFSVRNFSSSSTAETLETVSKYLEGSPVDWFQNLLLWTHSTTGLPWWATILINSVALRICFITPLTIYQMNTAARLENVQAELEGFVWKLKKESERSVQLNKYSKIMARRNYNKSVCTNAQGRDEKIIH
ncbi:uncharacterized protein LOC117170704 isoform X2 [Belonocnema kinseyi]|uniref:uncharacterized protein LOC117170704 isoform X2 n=1 Tax=Belonocnema kinseyi TaxID=2817044 RepID=UPI00143D3353|nr:uncharacterized protein LOC117170704 isoform X2 [Belonocnema kinseyi]